MNQRMIYKPGLFQPFEADAVIKPYSLVKIEDDGKIVACAAATDIVLGVTGKQGAAKAGDTVDIILDGIVLVRVHAAIASPAGDLYPHADGRVQRIAWAANYRRAGIWVGGAAGAQDDLVSMLITRDAGKLAA